MKTLSKLTILSLSATIVTSIAAAQPYPAYQVLDNLSSEQVTQLKQLGHISQKEPVNPVYEAKVQSILTPAQNAEYTSKMYGPRTPSNSNNFNFNMDSK
ncbi:hypothetical protein [Wohlfahrtiimonas larvae]|uniref:DUF4148 domain-containing protein n=1 Tax=Wohlfahrtiimonas larvae TaxID=1157986 RepID=A0ABP9MF79_9GAMM|nr:hypothetical protein [Wohlfahrtiimonas larvae]